MTPEQRREAFINDIVEVCKRHRVIPQYDKYEQQTDWESHRHDGNDFIVFGSDIESAVLEAVWPIVHGDADKI